MDRYTGTILKDRFVLEDVLGHGGMAVVYRATDRVTGNTVAVKILKEEFVSDEQFRRRFLNESRAISMLRHRNIVSVIDFDFEGNLQYIVMEYIDGITLKDFMRTQKIIPAGIAIKITMQMLSALQHAHERGVIHRDIKPQNIMILNDGTIKVMDFGIARINKFETVTMTDKAIGTVYYISPEQARGERTDERSDIYSVGIMLYETLTGELPFDGDTPVSVALKQIQSAAKRPRSINRAIPAGLEQIVMRAIMKTPQKRYPTALDMINDLKKVLIDETATFDYDLSEDLPKKDDIVLAGQKVPKPKFWTRGNILAMIAGVAAAGILIGLVIFLLAGSGGNASDPISNTVFVPDLINRPYEEVRDATSVTDNFRIEVTEEYNADFDAGIIFSQNPAKDTEVEINSTITIIVSKGAQMLKVPNIVGRLLADAERMLESAGITNYQVIPRQSDEVETGLIIETSPGANEEIKTGEKLLVYVSSGEALIEMPDLIGKTKPEAIVALFDTGLKYVFGEEEYHPTIPAGQIMLQSVDPGEMTPLSKEIMLIVSKGPEPEPEPEPGPGEETNNPNIEENP